MIFDVLCLEDQVGYRSRFGEVWGRLLEGSWVPLERLGTALGRHLGRSWEALRGFQEASWTKKRRS